RQAWTASKWPKPSRSTWSRSRRLPEPPSGFSAHRLQRSDALFDRRVRAEQAADAAGNTHGRHALRQLGRLHAAEAREGVDHRLLAAHELGGARVGTEFALTREPGNDDRGQEAEDDVEHDGRDEIADARAAVFVVAA